MCFVGGVLLCVGGCVKGCMGVSQWVGWVWKHRCVHLHKIRLTSIDIGTGGHRGHVPPLFKDLGKVPLFR